MIVLLSTACLAADLGPFQVNSGWIATFTVTWGMPVSSIFALVTSTGTGGLIYFAFSAAIGISLLFVRRHVRDGLPGIGIESDLAPAIRVIVWSAACPFVVPFGLLGADLRAARL